MQRLCNWRSSICYGLYSPKIQFVASRWSINTALYGVRGPLNIVTDMAIFELFFLEMFPSTVSTSVWHVCRSETFAPNVSSRRKHHTVMRKVTKFMLCIIITTGTGNELYCTKHVAQQYCFCSTFTSFAQSFNELLSELSKYSFCVSSTWKMSVVIYITRLVNHK